MFLSKKNASYFNKPKSIDPNKPRRILAGWQDDEEEKKETYDLASRTQGKTPLVNKDLLAGGFQEPVGDRTESRQQKSKFYLNWDELDEKEDIECQKKLVEEIVQPGGIRIKPNDNMLNQFFKETKGMDVHIISSLLLSKIEVNYPFQVKAKAIYTIEFMIKKNDKYLAYFKAHFDKLKDFPQPQDNVENYRKILKTVLNYIGISEPVQQDDEEHKQVFVDPGYNDQPKKQSKLGTFIQGNANKPKKTQNKKAIIGPGQLKPVKAQEQKNTPANQEFLSLDLLGTGNTPASKIQGQINLLNDPQGAQKNGFTFDQFFGSNPSGSIYPNNLI